MTKILIHAHVFYPELWKEISDCIHAIHDPFDLFVTTIQGEKKLQEEIKSTFPKAFVLECSNKGFDVFPFIYVINRINLSDYDFIIKLHTKRNIEKAFINGFDLSGNRWRKEALSFCSKWEDVKNLFNKKQNIGMIGSGKLITRYRCDCDKEAQDFALNLAHQWGLKVQKDVSFVAGTIFVVRAKLFECLQNKFTENDFEPSVRVKKIALAYILERLFGIVVIGQGYCIEDVDLKKSYYNRTYFLRLFFRFLFKRQKTSSGKFIIKICKIPVFVSKNNGGNYAV